MPNIRIAWAVIALLALADVVGIVWLTQLWQAREAERADQHLAQQLAAQAQREAIAADARRAADAARRPVLLPSDRQGLLPALHAPQPNTPPPAPLLTVPPGAAPAGSLR